LEKVKITAGGNGQLTAIMTVGEEHQNRGGFMHGAMTTLLVDSLSGLALLSYPNITSAGVSVNINMSYMKAVAVGQEIVIKASTEKVGKRLAFLTVDILNKETGDIVAKGTHTKYIG
jgi:acyl-coenzyme A thioesterase 13